MNGRLLAVCGILSVLGGIVTVGTVVQWAYALKAIYMGDFEIRTDFKISLTFILGRTDNERLLEQ